MVTCTCTSKRLSDCAGHFGYIQLELPVFHVGYFRHTLVILQCICKKCSRILLPEGKRSLYLRKMRSSSAAMDALTKGSLFKKIVDECKKEKTCPHCEYSNGNFTHRALFHEHICIGGTITNRYVLLMYWVGVE